MTMKSETRASLTIFSKTQPKSKKGPLPPLTKKRSKIIGRVKLVFGNQG